MRLSSATLAQVPACVARFDYPRDQQRPGIVHIGIGAFHRAHQAWYTDRAMSAGDRDWGIVGVSLRSSTVGEQLNPQDGLYSLAERSSAGTSLSVIGAVQRVLVAGTQAAEVVRYLGATETRVVTFTITEKAYCRAPDGTLDRSAAAASLLYRLLLAGLRERRAAGLSGVTLLSCDNLPNNGDQLKRLLLEYVDEHDPALARWTERECAFPSSMVDRIVPATTPEDREAVAELLGMRDEATVVTEPFSQWVIEDRFAAGRPRWEGVGAQIVSDVGPFETAKLRMLNGAHSALAYLGLERGYRSVHEAMADPELRHLVEGLMGDEATGSFEPAPGQDLRGYSTQLRARFANPALDHRLAQIAIDGSQKIPQRWLATVNERRARGLESPAILHSLGAWLRHVRGDNGAVDDPLAARLAELWRGVGARGIVDALFGPHGLIAPGLPATDAALLSTAVSSTRDSEESLGARG